MSGERGDGMLERAFTAVPDGTRPRPDCPPPDRLWLGVRNELDAAELQELLLHLAACPLCTRAWEMAEELEGVPAEVVPLDTGSEPQQRRWGWLASAAVLLVALLVPLLMRGPGDPGPVMRNPGQIEIRLLSAESLPREEFLLRWEVVGVAEGSEPIRFDLQVSPPGSMELVLDERDLTVQEFLVEPSLLRDLPDGSVLKVRFEARDPFEGRLDAVTFPVTLQ